MPTRCNRWFLLEILLLAQNVSGTIMPIIRSSRVLYRWLLPVVFGAVVFKLSVWCGAEGCVSSLQLSLPSCHILHLRYKHSSWCHFQTPSQISNRCLKKSYNKTSSAAAAPKPDTQPSAPHHTDNLKTKAPNTTGNNHLYNTLELLTMGIMVPETCWASNKICNKNHLLHLVGILSPQM